jgi:hypothetical protein
MDTHKRNTWTPTRNTWTPTNPEYSYTYSGDIPMKLKACCAILAACRTFMDTHTSVKSSFHFPEWHHSGQRAESAEKLVKKD